MEYLDEVILKERKELEYQSHTTLEAGIYVDDNLITFTEQQLEDLNISVYLPDDFILMPPQVKDIKYPSKEAPDVILTSLSSTINIGFSKLEIIIEEKDTVQIREQFQNVIKNVNPSIMIMKNETGETNTGQEMSWFDFRGYSVDGQSYNRMYFYRMKKFVIHGIFNCPMSDKVNWSQIVDQLYCTVQEL